MPLREAIEQPGRSLGGPNRLVGGQQVEGITGSRGQNHQNYQERPSTPNCEASGLTEA